MLIALLQGVRFFAHDVIFDAGNDGVVGRNAKFILVVVAIRSSDANSW